MQSRGHGGYLLGKVSGTTRRIRWALTEIQVNLSGIVQSSLGSTVKAL
jgi:hypothetical protein